jgi:hypothetical protein
MPVQILCGGWDYREKTRDVSDIRNFISTAVTDRPVPTWTFQLLDVLERNDASFSACDIRVRRCQLLHNAILGLNYED